VHPGFSGQEFIGAFTPCSSPFSLLEKNKFTAFCAAFGDVILRFSAYASFAQFRLPQGSVISRRRTAKLLAGPISGGVSNAYPNRQVFAPVSSASLYDFTGIFQFASGFFEEKPRRKNSNNIASTERALFCVN